jgi:hypothetical protein
LDVDDFSKNERNEKFGVTLLCCSPFSSKEAFIVVREEERKAHGERTFFQFKEGLLLEKW